MHASVLGFAALFALLSLGACSESSTSPKHTAPRTPSAPAFDLSATGFVTGLSVTSFVVDSRGGSFAVGPYTVDFPANSVCDPNTSSYGATEWDNSCTVLAGGQSVTINATVSLSSSGLVVDFTPALRFSPSTKVTISTDAFASLILANRDYYQKNHGALNELSILYSSSLGAKGVRDFSTDKSVMTHVDLNTGRIWRRVKHFSGYSIISGEACEPSPDNPDCVEVDDGETHQ
jgi:hypothetical protein